MPGRALVALQMIGWPREQQGTPEMQTSFGALSKSLAAILDVSFLRTAQDTAALGHEDPVAPILIALVLIGMGAAIGGRLMRKLGQPAVLGELLIGMLAANLAYYFREPVITVLREGETIGKLLYAAVSHNISVIEAARRLLPDNDHTQLLIQVLSGPAGPTTLAIYQFVDLLSRLAVIILLFLVGLETSVSEMKKVGWTAFWVASIGVVAPFLLGLGVIAMLIPDAPLAKGIFIGAIFTATSVGITARVFRDLKQTHRTEAKIILGAAVIDDVMGLIILAVVSGLVVTGTISLLSASLVTLKATAFLVVAIGLGVWIAPRLAKRVARMDIENSKLLFGMGVAFLFSWLANLVGLAPIVGAFAAGLILEEFFLQEFKGHSLRDLLSPLESLIVPVFFMLMGMQVKLETFADLKVVFLAAVLTLAAILGKVVSGLACSRGVDRLSVGIGMMPRGEVGLIFASIGKGLGVVSDEVFSAVVIMVMVTTLLAPPLLKITLARSAARTST
jgi:Kef-type K+ transport system membrane component KefB